MCGTCFKCNFSQGIHLKGCRQCKRALGHARRRRHRRRGQVVQVYIYFFKICVAHVLCVFFQKKCNESGVDVVKGL